jgi:hypothetical protein
VWLTDQYSQESGAAVVDRLDVLRVTFPHGDLFVGMNANQHGVRWSRAEGERLRDLPDAQGATLARKRFRLRVLSRLLLVTLVAAWCVVLLVF